MKTKCKFKYFFYGLVNSFNYNTEVYCCPSCCKIITKEDYYNYVHHFGCSYCSTKEQKESKRIQKEGIERLKRRTNENRRYREIKKENK